MYLVFIFVFGSKIKTILKHCQLINEDFKNTKFIIKCHHFTIVKAA